MVYNEELRRMNRPTWRNVSWLYSECYLYTSATLSTQLIFQTSPHNVRFNHPLDPLRSILSPKRRSLQIIQNWRSRTSWTIPRICESTLQHGWLGGTKITICKTFTDLRIVLTLFSILGRNGAHLFMGECFGPLVLITRRYYDVTRKTSSGRRK